jgi:hypothetical protein
MKAHSGDWLVVHSHTDGGPVRRAEIIATGVDGNPPYTVRWVEDDRESVVFPGPDAQVVSAEEQAEIHRLESAHIEKVQAELGSRGNDHEGVQS